MSTQSERDSLLGSILFEPGPAPVRGEREAFASPAPMNESLDEESPAPPKNQLDSWESMRINFSAEALDHLAQFYNSFTKDSVGRRTIYRSDLIGAAQTSIDLPEQAVTNELDRCKHGNSITVHSLLPLLEFMNQSKLNIIKSNPETLWSWHDMEKFKAAFSHHADRPSMILTSLDAHRKLSVKNLFDFIGDIDIHDLDLRPSQQQFFADIIREMHETLHPNWSPARIASQMGGLTLHESVYVLTKAIHKQQCELRREVLSTEQYLRHECGLSIAEVEDLRELHKTFLARLDLNVLGTAAQLDNETVSDQLIKLLERCGVKKLTVLELKALRNILSQKPLPSERPDSVPFDCFAFWMHGIFQENLGGLELQNGSEEQKLQSNGFIGTLLRECGTAVATGSKIDGGKGRAADAHPSTPLEVVSYQPSDVSDASSTEESSSAMAKKTRQNRRRKTLTLSSDGVVGKDSSPRKVNKSGSRSSITHDATLQGRSKVRLEKSSSREDLPERRDSRCSNAAEPLQDRGKEGNRANIFGLKGLPPSEAMLSRREIRACSEDHDPAIFLEQLNAALPPEFFDKSTPPDAAARESGPMCEVSAAAAFASRGSAAPALQRKVKPVQDAATVVQGAIARLDNLADNQLGSSRSSEATSAIHSPAELEGFQHEG